MTAPDTIAAIATATGAAGIGIVRLSGQNAFAIADTLIRAGQSGNGKSVSVSERTSRMLHRVRVYDPVGGDLLDDGLVAVFPAPRSLTGEDVVELQGHGGTVTLGRVLAACFAAGARAAQPGEFTLRAFLNGKMDLAQAEAVADLVNAQTTVAQRAARQQLSGALSSVVRLCVRRIQDALAPIEASIDFPEEIGDPAPEAIDLPLADALGRITALLRTSRYGQRLREGVTVVFAGRPNVGKSSLMNALAGRERSIVSPLPGTTRDVVEEALNLGGLPVRALDTAGLRDTTDPIEQIGIERAYQAVADADVVVLVLDAEVGWTDADDQFLQTLRDRVVVVAMNKADKSDRVTVPEIPLSGKILPVVLTSATKGDGLDTLAQQIAQTAGADSSLTEIGALVTNTRHEAALHQAKQALENARATLAEGKPLELVAVDAHGALHALGEITGETVREDIIAGIFSRFCIGK